jgi:hypothetical protein
MDPRARLDYMEKRKFLTLPGLEHRPLGLPARSLSPYTDYAVSHGTFITTLCVFRPT